MTYLTCYHYTYVENLDPTGKTTTTRVKKYLGWLLSSGRKNDLFLQVKKKGVFVNRVPLAF